MDPPRATSNACGARPASRWWTGRENRLVFIGMDQSRDKLLYAQVPETRTPSRTCARAPRLYQAIDIQAIKTKLMNGFGPHGGLTPSPLGPQRRRPGEPPAL